MTDDTLALAFLGTFESLRMGPAFARGRRDERAGHVRQLTISSSLIVALVRGPEDTTAYRSRIALRAFGAADWARVEGALAAEARFAADLLDGRMPAGIGGVFAEAGLSLAPLSLDEVAMDCSCERWPMPCVHLTATIYALVRRFDEDPFSLFTWRGRSRDELLTHLRELRGARAVEAALPADEDDDAAEPGRSGDLGDVALFWGEPAAPVQPAIGAASPLAAIGSASDFAAAASGTVASGSASGASSTAAVAGEALVVAPAASRPGSAARPDALLDQLDPPPLAHDGRPIVELLRPAYLALPDR